MSMYENHDSCMKEETDLPRTVEEPDPGSVKNELQDGVKNELLEFQQPIAMEEQDTGVCAEPWPVIEQPTPATPVQPGTAVSMSVVSGDVDPLLLPVKKEENSPKRLSKEKTGQVTATKIRSQKGGDKWIDKTGYEYHVVKQYAEHHDTLRCTLRRTHGCKARAIVRYAGCLLTSRGPLHNHPPDTSRLVKLTLVAAIERRVIAEATPIKTIFDQETARPEFDLGSTPLQLTEIRGTMYKRRSTARPPVPPTLEAYGRAVMSKEWMPRFGLTKGPVPVPFPRQVLRGPDGQLAVVFANQTMCDRLLRGRRRILVDSSFKAVPRVPKSSHLFTIHVMHRTLAIPVAYALMLKRDESSYRQVLEFFSAELCTGNPTVSTVTADYEPALARAICKTFPHARLLGCWFHYVQSVYKKAVALGYAGLMCENSAARKAVGMLASLPLLPPDQLLAGLNAVHTRVREGGLHNTLEPLMSAVWKKWIVAVGVRSLSVYRQPRRTSDHVEAFHKLLRSYFTTVYPEIWKFTEILITIENRFEQTWIKLSIGSECFPKRRPAGAHQNTRINKATAKLELGTLDVDEFLSEMSCVAQNLEELHFPVANAYRPQQTADDDPDVPDDLDDTEDDDDNLDVLGRFVADDEQDETEDENENADGNNDDIIDQHAIFFKVKGDQQHSLDEQEAPRSPLRFMTDPDIEELKAGVRAQAEHSGGRPDKLKLRAVVQLTRLEHEIATTDDRFHVKRLMKDEDS